MRAIKSGKLSASRTESGAYEIAESELARVFPFAGDIAGTMKRDEPDNGAASYPAISPDDQRGPAGRTKRRGSTVLPSRYNRIQPDAVTLAALPDHRRIQFG